MITIYPLYGFSENVTLAASNLPDGVTATFSPNPDPGNPSRVLTLTATPTAKTGTQSVLIKGTSLSWEATTTLSLTVETVENENN